MYFVLILMYEENMSDKQMYSIIVIISIYVMIIKYKIILFTSLHNSLLLLSYLLSTASSIFRLRTHSGDIPSPPLPIPSIYFQDSGQRFSPFVNHSQFPWEEGISYLPSPGVIFSYRKKYLLHLNVGPPPPSHQLLVLR